MVARRELIDAAKVRRDKVARMYLDGVTSQVELANAFSVCEATIHKDIVYLRKKWQKEQPKSTQKQRIVSLRRLESLLEKSIDSYYRSKKDAEETTISTRQDNCGSCYGRGSVKDESCSNCDGTGKVEMEVVTRKIKGQAGDSSFLSTALKCVAEINKLKGLYEEQKKTKEHHHSGEIIHSHVNGNRYKDATTEQILKLKQVMYQIENSSTPTNESHIIDVEVEPSK